MCIRDSPGTPDGATRVAEDHVENAEAASTGGREIGGLDLAENGRLLAWPQRGDCLHAAAVLIAEWQAVKKILDRDEARALEIRGLTRADPLQELKRGDEHLIAHSLHHDGLPRSDVDLLDARGQRERVVQPNAVRAVFVPGVVRKDFLYQESGDRDAGNIRRLQIELPAAVFRAQDAA